MRQWQSRRPDLSLRGAPTADVGNLRQMAVAFCDKRCDVAISRLCWISRKLRRKRNCSRNDTSGERFGGGPVPSFGASQCQIWEQGAAERRHQTQSCRCALSTPCTNWKCLPEIAPCTNWKRFALRAPRRFAPRNDTSGSAAVHQCPPAVEWLCTRRSLPARARRIRKAAKPPTAAQGAPLQTNLSARFYRHLVRTGSAFPRLPRRFAPRNDNLGECRGAPVPSCR